MLDDIRLPDMLSLRMASPDDEAFMVALFSSDKHHLKMINLPADAIEQLLQQQYRARQYSWQVDWPHAMTFIVMRLGNPIGKLTLHREAKLLHLVDIIFTVAARGKGYGTIIIKALLALADDHCDQFQLSVSKDNPRAKNLYLSLGLQVVEVGEFYERLNRDSKCLQQPSGTMKM